LGAGFWVRDVGCWPFEKCSGEQLNRSKSDESNTDIRREGIRVLT